MLSSRALILLDGYTHGGESLPHRAWGERLQEDRAHYTVAVNEIGCRYGSYAIDCVDCISLIEEERIGNAKINAKPGNVIQWIGLIDTEHGKFPVRAILRIGTLQVRNFCTTGKA